MTIARLCVSTRLALPCLALACLVVGGCASDRAKLPAAASVSPLAHLLVVQGALTEEGQRRRHAAQHFVARERNADAYAAWLPLAAGGHPESQYNIGLMTRQGIGTRADMAASLAWMRRAAAAGYRDALVELGLRHAGGAAGVAKDDAEALRLFLRAADLGDANAAFYAGQYLYDGGAGQRDSVRAVELLLQAAQAEAPSVKAQALLGRIYLLGGAVMQDHAQARYWIEQAAAADDAEAQFHLGLLHQHGQGLAKNLHKAHGWYLRAAQQGFAPALNQIGLLYRHGEGVRKNLVLARKRFEDAYGRGSMDAAVNLGELLLGAGSSAEQQRAISLFKAAAIADHREGQCRYGQALQAVEPEKAGQWLERARLAGLKCKAATPRPAMAKAQRSGDA